MKAQKVATKSGWLMMQRVFFLPEKYVTRYRRHATPAIIGNMNRAPCNSVINSTIVAALQKVNAIPSHFSPVVFAGGVSADFVSQYVGIKVLYFLILVNPRTHNTPIAIAAAKISTPGINPPTLGVPSIPPIKIRHAPKSPIAKLPKRIIANNTLKRITFHELPLELNSVSNAPQSGQ
jgi:hypothetical protein